MMALFSRLLSSAFFFFHRVATRPARSQPLSTSSQSARGPLSGQMGSDSEDQGKRTTSIVSRGSRL